MDKHQIGKLKQSFDDISHFTEDNTEFWYARELQALLGYSQWRNFETVIEKAKISCIKAKHITKDDFADVSKIVETGATKRPISDMMLTRYACYLIAQNGDPRKDEIAFAQTTGKLSVPHKSDS